MKMEGEMDRVSMQEVIEWTKEKYCKSIDDLLLEYVDNKVD